MPLIQKLVPESQNKPEYSPFVLSILSGKGGVGKTTVATNLSSLLSAHCSRTLLVDADTGLANAHILFGVQPKLCLADFLIRNQPFEKVIETVQQNLDVVSGANGIPSVGNLSKEKRQSLLHALKNVTHNYNTTVIDCPSGISDNTLDFCQISDLNVIVLTEEPTSFINAYTTIKTVASLWEKRNIAVIINYAKNKQQAQNLFLKFQDIVTRFLDIELKYLGCMHEDYNVCRAITCRKLLVDSLPNTRAACDLLNIMCHLTSYTNHIQERTIKCTLTSENMTV
jgi:flagellar biosynthesis protein FlhG